MQFIEWQKAQCPVCAHRLHSNETEVLENNGSWSLIETSCHHCGSSTVGILVGRGKRAKHVKLLSDIPRDRHDHDGRGIDSGDERMSEKLFGTNRDWAES